MAGARLSVMSNTVLSFSTCGGLFDIVVSRIRKGLFKSTSITFLATCRGAQIALWSMDSITLFLGPTLFTNTGLGACSTCMTAFAMATLCYKASAKGVKKCFLSMWFSTVAASVVFVTRAFILTGCKCQGMSVRLAGKIARMYLSMRDDPKYRSTARLSTAPSHTRMGRWLICKCSTINLIELIGCLFTPLSLKRSRRLLRDIQIECQNDLLTKFEPAPVPIKHSTLATSCDLIPKRTYVLTLMLANSAVLFCSALSGHTSAEEHFLGTFNSPFSSFVRFSCSAARCCDVGDDADLNVSDYLSCFRLSDVFSWVSLYIFLSFGI